MRVLKFVSKKYIDITNHENMKIILLKGVARVAIP
jgi:hypothetical protein